jgi:phosphatidylglycerol lysyltransferase
MATVASMPAELQRARALVLAHGWNATAYQILHPDIRLWFAAAGDAVVGYVRHGRTRVVAGAPVCAAARVGAVAAEFTAAAASQRERVCWFAAESRLAAVAAGERVCLGAQPVWRPDALVARFAAHRSLRAQLHRARNKGVAVAEVCAASAVDDAGLQRCRREWLATRGLPTLHFLTEPRTLVAPLDRRLFVATRDGRTVAFLVAAPIPARRGWLVEQIVRGRGACNGTAELLLAAAARAFAASGAELLTLGLAPLAPRGQPTGERPPWRVRALLAWLRAHGRRFYDFRGIEAWKAKFGPERWEPVYALAAPGVGLGSLYAIAGAFARGSPWVLMARGLWRATGIELRRTWSRRR